MGFYCLALLGKCMDWTPHAVHTHCHFIIMGQGGDLCLTRARGAMTLLILLLHFCTSRCSPAAGVCMSVNCVTVQVHSQWSRWALWKIIIANSLSGPFCILVYPVYVIVHMGTGGGGGSTSRTHHWRRRSAAVLTSRRRSSSACIITGEEWAYSAYIYNMTRCLSGLMVFLGWSHPLVLTGDQALILTLKTSLWGEIRLRGIEGQGHLNKQADFSISDWWTAETDRWINYLGNESNSGIHHKMILPIAYTEQ